MPPPHSGESRPARRVAVLAGGAGIRMGGAKAGVELAGRPLISYALAAAEAAGLEAFVVAKSDSALPPLDSEIVVEPGEPRHPLTGIIAALEFAAEPIVVVTCDVPLVPPPLLAALATSTAPFTMPDHPRAQPLVARYTPELLLRLQKGLSESASMTSVVAALGGDRLGEGELRPFGDPERIFANVNEPEDITRIEALLEEMHGFSRPG